MFQGNIAKPPRLSSYWRQFLAGFTVCMVGCLQEICILYRLTRMNYNKESNGLAKLDELASNSRDSKHNSRGIREIK